MVREVNDLMAYSLVNGLPQFPTNCAAYTSDYPPLEKAFL